MYLKRLEAQGFKSFADKVNMDFGKGITAIVGPNGSGKSNISDAIRWVMGEQSAKSLRGGSMQDVIFAGTQKRKALGFAEVSIFIDNTSKTLAIDYDEVVITRRVFRSGESEYFINKATCRLRDIHEMFMDTGVGRDGYSIIGQGKISEIIGSKAEDRRQIFEEAAGITKYRSRKEEAERKLERTRENMTRVGDIISELEIQLEPLRIQSEKAKKFLVLRDKLKELEVNVSLENIEKFKAVLAEAEEICGDVERQAAQVRSRIEKLETDGAALFDAMRLCGEDMEKKAETQSGNVNMLAEVRRDVEVLKSKIGYNDESIKRIESEIAELNLKLDEFELSLAEKDGGAAELHEKERLLQDEAAQIEAQIAAIADGERQKSGEARATDTDIIEKMNDISAARGKIGNYKALSDSFDARRKTIETEREVKDRERGTLAGKVGELKQRLDEKQTEMGNLVEKSENISREITKIRQEYQQKQEDSRQAQSRFEQAQARKKLLEDMENSFDNYSRSVKTIMQSHKSGALKGTAIYGTVAQLLKVPEKYAAAIEATLGAAAQNIVTESEEDAKRAIEFLKREKVGRATFLPVSASRSSVFDDKSVLQCEGCIGIAARLITFDKKFEAVANSLLGRIIVADNLDNAVKMARKYRYSFRIVTLDGDLLTPGGAISGGSRQGGTGLFARAGELERLRTSVVDLQREFEAERDGVSAMKSALDRLILREAEAAAEARAVQEECVSLAAEHKHSDAFLESMAAADVSLNAEQQQISARTAEMAAEIERLNDTIELLNSEIAALEKQSSLEKEDAARLAAQREEQNAALIEVKMRQSDVKKDIELYNERVELVKSRKAEIEKSVEAKLQNIEEIAEKNEDLSDDIEFKNGQAEELELENAALKMELEALKTSRRIMEDDIKQSQKDLTDERETQLKLQEELARVESKRAKIESELENTVNRLWDEYELTVSAAEELRTDIGSVTAAQKEINALKNEIKDLGNINIDAIAEYAGISERFEFLTTQRADLEDAQKNLESVIADMVAVMRDQFAEKFKIINEHFNEIFAELFGGGKAKLSLTDPSNVLESGVNIEVQPPGKAVKSMALLSGGEQAFVSIALLFAILKVRVSPFCILDEIEAALDDVNVFRFADFLKKFAEKSQFIVVTHRRGTMESANMLYGITMQEQGVTNVLPLNIDQIEIDTN